MKTEAATAKRLDQLLKRLERAAARIEQGASCGLSGQSDRDELRRAQAEISTLRALNETIARRLQAAIDRARTALDE